MLSMIQVQVQHSFYRNFPPPLATHALRPYLTTFLLSNFPPPLATHAFNDSSSSTTFLLSNFPPPLGLSKIKTQHPDRMKDEECNPYWFVFTFLSNRGVVCDTPTSSYVLYCANHSHRNTLLRPYPTTVSHQQFRTQVGSQNTPYTAKHSIQTRKRATEICSQRTARNFSTPRKTPVLRCGDPTQLLFPINNSEHR